MDTVKAYRTAVQKLLYEYAQQRSATPGVETQVIADLANDHYQLVNVGWQNHHRIYGCVLHIDVKGDKIWIQHNMTEQDIAEDLVKRGIPKQSIVIGFHSPYKRQFTEYALN
ncbi:MAG: XisI protein [Caldilineaceae bacterium]